MHEAYGADNYTVAEIFFVDSQCLDNPHRGSAACANNKNIKRQ